MAAAETVPKSAKTSGSSPRATKRPPPLSAAATAPDDDDDAELGGEWVPMQSRTQGRPYYFHTQTRETVWEKPPDYVEDLPEGSDGWLEMESKSQGRWYYYNPATHETVWERPPGVPEPPPFARRPPNPKREALRDVIQDWSDAFFEQHGREPSEGDLKPGSDIARHHRDYKMLKHEEEVELLRAEQVKLRKELDPSHRERLVEIKGQLADMEPKLDEWKATKEAERTRRAEVTKVYNAWIKSFQETHHRLPTEHDIEDGSAIQGMHDDYTRYRKEAKAAKERAARIEVGKLQKQSTELKRILKVYAEDFRLHHNQREPYVADIPDGSEWMDAYQRYADIERKINPENPALKLDSLKEEIDTWSKKYEDVHSRKPTRDEQMSVPKMRAVTYEYEALRDKAPCLAGVRVARKQPAQAPWPPGIARDYRDDDYRPDAVSPPYQRARGYPPGDGREPRSSAGCGDCCVAQ